VIFHPWMSGSILLKTKIPFYANSPSFPLSDNIAAIEAKALA
jgi:hypothetical protein